MSELYAVRARTLNGQQWVASDVLSRGRVVLSSNADHRYPLGSTRAEHFSELLRQQGDAVEVVPFYAADQPEPKPEPPRPKRTKTVCAYGRGHRHIVGECPLIEVEVDD